MREIRYVKEKMKIQTLERSGTRDVLGMQKAGFNGSFLEDTIGRMNNFVHEAKSRE